MGSNELTIHLNRICAAVTPALVFNESQIIDAVRHLQELTLSESCYSLYSLKACPVVAVIDLIAPHVDGFSCSSVLETQLVSVHAESGKQIQVVTPGLTADLLNSLAEPCPHLLTFNSIEQFVRLSDAVAKTTRLAIRVNPKTQFVKGEKYDPCRLGSKLGVGIEYIIQEMESNDLFREQITGIHVHNNCESDDFEQLRETVQKIKPLLRSKFGIGWINLGGGYQFNEAESGPFNSAVNELVNEFGLDVFFEPGDGLVRESGYLVSTIVDLFESDSDTVAVLDTTVNHAPEVFEYSWSPPVLGSEPDGKYGYILAGCSCLAGDLFGKYRFEHPLCVGQKVVFGSLGAYTMPKWSMFNGINLPNIYILTEDGELVLRKSFTFDDFSSRCGVSRVASN